MTILTDRLQEKRILVSDGAWGTMFASQGLEPGEAPERWNLDHPEKVLEVAGAYVAAGSDIILTNTFGASPFKLERLGLADKTETVNRRAAELSKEAAAGRALVFASIGPTGEFLAPLGPRTNDEMIAAFSRQAKGLAEGGADGIVIETFTDINEAKAALAAVKRTCDLPAIVSMTFDKGPAGFATMMGVKPEQAASELTAAGANAVGSNCGAGIEQMTEVAALMRGATDAPLWFKPNAGLPELEGGETVYRETPEAMAGKLAGLIEAGAAIVGGCCGTTPTHIERFAERVRALTS